MKCADVIDLVSGKLDNYLSRLNVFMEPITKDMSIPSRGVERNLNAFKNMKLMDAYLLGCLCKVNPYIYKHDKYEYDYTI